MFILNIYVIYSVFQPQIKLYHYFMYHLSDTEVTITNKKAPSIWEGVMGGHEGVQGCGERDIGRVKGRKGKGKIDVVIF